MSSAMPLPPLEKEVNNLYSFREQERGIFQLGQLSFHRIFSSM